MFINNITITNYGPIDDVSIDLPFDGAQPKPLVLVGQNGAGKSLLLANIVNALVVGRQEVFDDGEVEAGKVYKYRMPGYISSGKNYSYACVTFTSGAKVEELQLSHKKSSIAVPDERYSNLEIYQAMNPDQASNFFSTFDRYPGTASALYEQQCCLFFPVHRYEEPAWLNVENATKRASYTKRKTISRFSNRNLVASSPLEENRNWLMDVLLDRSIYDMQTPVVPVRIGPVEVTVNAQLFAGYVGDSNTVYEAVQNLIRIVLRQGSNVRLGVGSRSNRQISVMKNEEAWIPNLFQLSTGEVQLVNFFMSIVRDCDLSSTVIKDLSDIKGIVVVDEIDTHLHTSHQIDVLPELIASFPNVQFIITTHSPLFLIGLERKLGADGFMAIQMPTALPVSLEEFSEFGEAYEVFSQTERHKAEIKKSIDDYHKPVLYVEGDYDIRYINRAAQLLGKQAVLDKLTIRDGEGCGNLDKIWRGYENPTSAALPQKLILLYDCDTRKPNSNRGQVFKRTVPASPENPIAIGIENLFPPETIEKVARFNPAFIDVQSEMVNRVRNETVVIPASQSVNKDEKGNICNWLCENGKAEDFLGFEKVFEILSSIIEA